MAASTTSAATADTSNKPRFIQDYNKLSTLKAIEEQSTLEKPLFKQLSNDCREYVAKDSSVTGGSARMRRLEIDEWRAIVNDFIVNEGKGALYWDKVRFNVKTTSLFWPEDTASIEIIISALLRLHAMKEVRKRKGDASSDANDTPTKKPRCLARKASSRPSKQGGNNDEEEDDDLSQPEVEYFSSKDEDEEIYSDVQKVLKSPNKPLPKNTVRSYENDPFTFFRGPYTGTQEPSPSPMPKATAPSPLGFNLPTNYNTLPSLQATMRAQSVSEGRNIEPAVANRRKSFSADGMMEIGGEGDGGNKEEHGEIDNQQLVRVATNSLARSEIGGSREGDVPKPTRKRPPYKRPTTVKERVEPTTATSILRSPTAITTKAARNINQIFTITLSLTRSPTHTSASTLYLSLPITLTTTSLSLATFYGQVALSLPQRDRLALARCNRIKMIVEGMEWGKMMDFMKIGAEAVWGVLLRGVLEAKAKGEEGEEEKEVRVVFTDD
ncbi:MAG: hypothetical protein M1834_003495 [Cirrosporium novae-zelandiae]|nr:MAG: hypothetical protein M1834_003495 [Cirrosporium novae-zelandiae]